MHYNLSESKLLTQMVRVHNFLKHEQVEFFDLRTFDVDIKTADMLSRFLQTNIDLPDAILKMEEIAVVRNDFTEFLRKYLAEEYSIQEEYSFTVVALLHYQRKTGVSLDDAITDLISLSSNKTICSLCCSSGRSVKEKEKIVKFHNYGILNGLDILDHESNRDDSNSDDNNSTSDPEYQESDVSSGEIEDRSKDLASKQRKGYNPFDSSDEETSDPKLSLNSTISFNPFDDSESEDEHKLGNSSSSSKKSIKCDHCNKQFSNRYNMKLHLIGLVILKKIASSLINFHSMDWVILRILKVCSKSSEYFSQNNF